MWSIEPLNTIFDFAVHAWDMLWLQDDFETEGKILRKWSDLSLCWVLSRYKLKLSFTWTMGCKSVIRQPQNFDPYLQPDSTVKMAPITTVMRRYWLDNLFKSEVHAKRQVNTTAVVWETILEGISVGYSGNHVTELNVLSVTSARWFGLHPRYEVADSITPARDKAHFRIWIPSLGRTWQHKFASLILNIDIAIMNLVVIDCYCEAFDIAIMNLPGVNATMKLSEFEPRVCRTDCDLLTDRESLTTNSCSRYKVLES